MNIYPTVYSILLRDLDYSSGKYNSFVSLKEWKNTPLVYASGILWSDGVSDPIPTDENGKMILPIEKYIY